MATVGKTILLVIVLATLLLHTHTHTRVESVLQVRRQGGADGELFLSLSFRMWCLRGHRGGPGLG